MTDLNIATLCTLWTVYGKEVLGYNTDKAEEKYSLRLENELTSKASPSKTSKNIFRFVLPLLVMGMSLF